VFVLKVQDLRARMTVKAAEVENVEFEILMASPLLRELLIGDPPLMVTANREHHLKVRFAVARMTALEELQLKDGAVFLARGDGLYPGTALPNAEVVELNHDQFLRERVMVLHGTTLAIHDVIDYVANVAGGVHFGAVAAKERRALVEAVDQQVRLGGLQATLHALLAIGRVTVDALDPLVRHIDAP